MRYEEIKREVEQARQNLDNAEPDYVDIAIYQLIAAEKRLNQYLKEIREVY